MKVIKFQISHDGEIEERIVPLHHILCVRRRNQATEVSFNGHHAIECEEYFAPRIENFMTELFDEDKPMALDLGMVSYKKEF